MRPARFIVVTSQPEALLYHPTPAEFVIDTREKLERQIKDKIMNLRKKYITRWNRYCVQAFRKLLEKYVT